MSIYTEIIKTKNNNNNKQLLLLLLITIAATTANNVDINKKNITSNYNY